MERYPKGIPVDLCLWVPTIWPSKMALCALLPRTDTSRRAPTSHEESTSARGDTNDMFSKLNG